MFCTSCGFGLEDSDRFCAQCGKSTGRGSPEAATPSRRLVRPMHEKSIAGVCAGFARYLDMDVTLMRILWLCLAIFTGVGFIAYLVAWIVMPKDYSQMPAAAPVADSSTATYREGGSPAHSSQ